MRFHLDHPVITSLSTVFLALVTAWLAWDTHRLAGATSDELLVEHRVGLIRDCSIDTRDDVRAHDALITIHPQAADTFTADDELSVPDIFLTLKNPTQEYVRCTVTNFGKLPLLDVQTEYDADLPSGRKVTIVGALYHALGPNESRTTWIASEGKGDATIHAPTKIRYRQFRAPNFVIVEPASPAVSDSWVLRSNGDVSEDLDQSGTQPF